MNGIRKWLVEVLGFSNLESRGFLVFALACLLISLSFNYLSFTYNPEISIRQNQDKLNSFLEALKPIETEKPKRQNFDPNLAGFHQWKSEGLSDQLADNIIKYRLNGGFFKDASDLGKIYGMNDSILSRLEPRMFFTANEGKKDNKRRFNRSFSKPDKKVWREKNDDIAFKKPFLNSCDSSELLFIRGIGSVRAARIVKYREKLGGFYSEAQLNEVYGMDSLSISELKKNTILNSNENIRLLYINRLDFKDLLNHPYIDYTSCKIIFTYRKQHGPFSSLEDLKKIRALKKELIPKIAPYLSFE